MKPQRRLKLLKTRRWFKPLRGGVRVSGNKDYPTASQPRQRREPGNRWRVSNQQPRPQETEIPDQGKEKKVKITEAPIFIPYTRDSMLKKNLQRIDDTIGECLGSPAVRFVERCGGSNLIDTLKIRNP